MSLAPGEQRALAGIEQALRRSDPRLAAMLASFTVPRSQRLPAPRPWVHWGRACRVVAVAAAVVAACLAVWGFLVASQSRLPGCPAVLRGISLVQPDACRLASGLYAPPAAHDTGPHGRAAAHDTGPAGHTASRLVSGSGTASRPGT